jgi:autotransporter-associated beta strand protein
VVWAIAAVAGVCVASAGPTRARAAQCLWTGGGANAAWSTAANWNGCSGSAMPIPQSGDSVLFPTGVAGNGASQNDIANLSLASVDVGGPTTSNAAYAITGNQIALGSGQTLVFVAAPAAAGAGPAFGIPVLLGGPMIVNDLGTVRATVGAFDLNGFSLTLEPSSGDLDVAGAISGTGGLIKMGAGVAILEQPAAWSGPTDVRQGTLRMAATGSLPATGVVTLTAGATLDLSAGAAVIGGLQGAGGSLLISGASAAINQAGSTIFNGTISGPSAGGGLTKAGAGTLLLAGTAPNDYGGGTFVTDAGTLQLGKPSGVAAVGRGGLHIIGGTVTLAASEQIPDSNAVTLGAQAPATLDLNGETETVGSLGGVGAVSIGTGSLTVGGDNTSTNAGVGLSGSGSLTKVGSGTMGLINLSTPSPSYTGVTTVRAGALLVDTNLSGSRVQVMTGGTLGGTGIVGALAASIGRVAPGSTGLPGRLRALGGAVLDNDAELVIDVAGTTAVTGYDVLDVTGPVILNSPTLTIALGFDPPLASTYTVLVNDGSDAIAGTFAGLPEGSLFASGGRAFAITYRGGDGNDVELIAVPTPCELTLAGCAVDAGSPVDAGAPIDASGPADAGAPIDAGGPADAGASADAAAPDARDAALDGVPDLGLSLDTFFREAGDDVSGPGQPSDGGNLDAGARIDLNAGHSDRFPIFDDASTSTTSKGGCGCGMGAGAGTPAGWAGLLILALAAVLLGRRRRAR